MRCTRPLLVVDKALMQSFERAVVRRLQLRLLVVHVPGKSSYRLAIREAHSYLVITSAMILSNENKHNSSKLERYTKTVD